jgi:type VI secretion system secreted protein Hcp
MAIYMKFGTTTKGDVDTTQYKEWIMCHSFQFGLGRAIHSASGSGGNRQGSHASVSEVTITKALDPASLDLFSDALTGPLKTQVDFAFTLADADNKEFLHVTLWDTGVSGWSTSSGGERPSESVSLNFAKIEYKPTFYAVDGVAATPKMKTYDLTKHTIS